MRSILVVANDAVPAAGLPVSGSGLRAWGLGEGLRSRGHEVRYAVPTRSIPGDVTPPDDFLTYEDPELPGLLARDRADVLLFQHWPRLAAAAALDVPIVLDLHGPLMVETAFQQRPDADFIAMAGAKLAAFRRADFISCAGEFQRRYFLPWLTLAGGDVTTESVVVMPVSFPPAAPAHEANDGEVTFVYGGMFLPWQDPSLGLTTLASVLESEGVGRLDFFGAPHPMFEMEIGILAQIEDRLRTCSRVMVHGLRPRDELLDHYRRADVALDLMRRNNERDLAFTTRTVEYLWCGLPVVYGDYGELAPLVREYDAGWIVSPDDGDAIAETLRKILRDPADVRRRGANAQRLVRERLNWERTINPLDDFCRDPRRRSASHPPLVVAPTEAEALRAELTALRSTKTFRAFEPLRRLYARFRRA